MPGNPKNMKISKEKNEVVLFINPRIFSLDVIYSAAYVFIDKAYVMISGDPEKEIIVEIRPKTAGDPELLGREFNNELLNYSVYKQQVEKNSKIRETIIQRALITNTKAETEEDYEFEDPEGIAVPWEEKYGKKKD